MPTPDRHSTLHDPHLSAPRASSHLSVTAALSQLSREDVIGQLRRREGAMLRLGSENGVPMLDWVDAVPRLLADPAQLETVEQEARQLIERGIRHVIWAGMGGSVLTVQVLRALGYGDEPVHVHPLDSTDPRALNHLVRQLAEAKGITLPASVSPATSRTGKPKRRADRQSENALCRTLLADVVMVGVAMGKTSEEPISHLDWFSEVLRRGGLPTAEHLLVMSIPDSYLQTYAQSHGIPRLPLQLDGGAGTPGRMSAPATRVFLLPVAIDLAARGAPPGTLRTILATAWEAYDLDCAATSPDRHPYVQLAAALADAAIDGSCALWLVRPPKLDALRWWMEQLMEESLGKGGKGIVVFADQTLARPATARSGAPVRRLGDLRLRIATEPPPDGVEPAPTTNMADRSSTGPTADSFTLYQPLLASDTPADQLAGLAATFLGLQLCMALYGYLHDIPFAGQPAVEQYKQRARELRATADPVRIAVATTAPQAAERFRLLPPSTVPASTRRSPESALAAALAPRPAYLDLTINGEIVEQDAAALEVQLRQLGNDVLGIPVKLRRAPASYHSTEQSEMDGPGGLVSVRALAEHSDPSVLGVYDATFLRAQAVGTWMAMNEQGRTCFLLLYDGPTDELGPELCHFLARVAQQVVAPSFEGKAYVRQP